MQKTKLVLMLITLACSTACGTAEEVSAAGHETQASALAPPGFIGVPAGFRYWDIAGVCSERGTVMCGIGPFGGHDATTFLRLRSHEEVEVSYIVEPEFLFGRGGLAVTEEMPLGPELSEALGLRPDTVVHVQFAPLTQVDDGTTKLVLGVGPAGQPLPDPESFEPADGPNGGLPPCCPKGQGAWHCASCVGGSSSTGFAGSGCCLNSVHYDKNHYGTP